MRGLFIGSTGQHVGKTSVSLALLNVFKKNIGKRKIKYMKPIGQMAVNNVDKDAILFRSVFDLNIQDKAISPIVVDRNFTRRVDRANMECINIEYSSLDADFVLVEGSGHMGVGSCFTLNNASIANHLSLPIIMVVNGGIGKTVDKLALNLSLCEKHGADVIGCIINKVKPDKMSLVDTITRRKVNNMGIQVFGIVPDLEELGRPHDYDLELFGYDKLSQSTTDSIFDSFEVCTIGIQVLNDSLHDITKSKKLFVIHSYHSKDIRHFIDANVNSSCGFLITGKDKYTPTDNYLEDLFRDSPIPVFRSRDKTFETIKHLSNSVPKTSDRDCERVNKIISHYEKHIDTQSIFKSLNIRT